MPRAGKDLLQVAGPRRSFVRAIGDIAQRSFAGSIVLDDFKELPAEAASNNPFAAVEGLFVSHLQAGQHSQNEVIVVEVQVHDLPIYGILFLVSFL